MKFLLPLLLLCCCASAHAAESNACLMEGSFAIAGQNIEVRDCVQNDGEPHARLVETCNSLSQIGQAMGGAAAKITWLPACPAKPQARCDGMGGSKLSAYYYKRDAELLADSKTSCPRMKGRWVEGG